MYAFSELAAKRSATRKPLLWSPVDAPRGAGEKRNDWQIKREREKEMATKWRGRGDEESTMVPRRKQRWEGHTPMLKCFFFLKNLLCYSQQTSRQTSEVQHGSERLE
jgi:hypothetical protein